MNKCQTFNSWNTARTRNIFHLVQRRNPRNTSVLTHKKDRSSGFTNTRKMACWWGSFHCNPPHTAICISTDKSHLHYYQPSTICRGRKQLKDTNNVDNPQDARGSASSHILPILKSSTSLTCGRGWGGWMASLTQQIRVWANSARQWRTGKPGVRQFVGLQRVGH